MTGVFKGKIDKGAALPLLYFCVFVCIIQKIFFKNVQIYFYISEKMCNFAVVKLAKMCEI